MAHGDNCDWILTHHYSKFEDTCDTNAKHAQSNDGSYLATTSADCNIKVFYVSDESNVDQVNIDRFRLFLGFHGTTLCLLILLLTM